MKKLLFAAAILIASAGFYSFAPKAGANKLAPLTVALDKSRIDWVAAKKSDFHTGSFSLKSGELQVDGGKLKGGKFVIDLANLKVTDASGDRLAGHLKSGDFFDVAKFGEATYEITGVNYTGATTADITGNLSIKGTSVPVKFQAQIRNADEKGFFAQAFFTLDKTALGITYGAGNVSNDVQVAVHLFAK